MDFPVTENFCLNFYAAMKLRNVTRVPEPGKIVSEEYMAMKDAPETLLVRVEARKR